MHVAVLIVAFGNAHDVVRCMKALELSTHTDFEVVVCENGGKQAYETLSAALCSDSSAEKKVRLIESPNNGGFASGVNICFRATPNADLWWILNPDTEPDPEAMEAMVTRLSKADCDAVGGTLYFPDKLVQSHGGVWLGWLAKSASIGYGTSLELSVNQTQVERRLSYLSGASMMIGRRFRATVGDMREDYFLYCEEVAWYLEASRKGMRLGFAPNAKVLHYQGTSTGYTPRFADQSRTSVYLGARNIILVTRDYYSKYFWSAALAALLDLALRYIRRGAWRQLSYAISGWRAGMRNERGPLKISSL